MFCIRQSTVVGAVLTGKYSALGAHRSCCFAHAMRSILIYGWVLSCVTPGVDHRSWLACH
jgi:hypothetical protein